MMRNLALLTLLFIALSACVDYKTTSTRTNDTIKIDGESSEWQGKLDFFEDEQFAIGFQHDENNLYMCITTNDRDKARQFLTRGINIWFDTGIEKKYAVRFPVFDKSRMKESFRAEREQPGERGDMIRDILNNQTQFLLVNEDDYPLGTYFINGNSGIKLKPGMTKDLFVFELQYALKPIDDNTINFLEMNDNNELTITFESVEFKMPDGPGGFPGGERSGMNRGNTPPMGGERGNMGRRPPFDREKMEDIDFSINVVLKN